MSKRKENKNSPEVHQELKGFDIQINEFGEIISNLGIDKINHFLNENLDDKKLRPQQEQEEE